MSNAIKLHTTVCTIRHSIAHIVIHYFYYRVRVVYMSLIWLDHPIPFLFVVVEKGSGYLTIDFCGVRSPEF